MNVIKTLGVIALIHLLTTVCFAENPIVQTIYTADPAPLVHNDTFFVYSGHDEDGSGWFNMKDWRCYSSTDMANWTDHGSPMNLKTFSWAGVDAWASQCVYRNGKFYWYVCIRLSGDKFGIGVGVSDKSTGPFTDAIGRPLLEGNNYLDPSVYIDSTGQAYMYWGNAWLWMVKLNPDMISVSGSVIEMPRTATTVNAFVEAPWLHKHNGLYYLAYAGQVPNRENIRYSTSSSPSGPWAYKGIIMPEEGASWTNHPGLADYKGNSYFVYHNGALPGGGNGTRSVCIEQFNYNADGTIPTFSMTKTGPAQIGHLDPYKRTEAETICWELDVETGVCSEGGVNVDSIHNNDYIKVKGVDFGGGASSFDARVASARTGGNIELHLDSLKGAIIGTCAVTGTSGWQTWVTKTCSVTGATGVHDLYLKFTGASGRLFNFNWWKFNAATGIGSSNRENGAAQKSLKIKTCLGDAASIQLDFDLSVYKGNIHVCLFDLNGRLVTTLYTGHLSTGHLTLPLNRTKVQSGTFLIRVLLNGKVMATDSRVIF